MTLSFGTKYKDGSPNHFVEKIWAGQSKGEALMKRDVYQPDTETEFTPKIHTLRADPKNRWKVGMTINCVLFNRTKNRYEFSTLVCTAIQKVEICHFPNHTAIAIYEPGLIRGLEKPERQEFIRNDGFENEEQFKAWFPDDGMFRLIHWTEKRY